MAKKRQYHYLVVFYKIEKEGKTAEWNCSTVLCSTNETNPAGIPTRGYLIKRAKEDAIKQGGKYIDDTLYINNMIKLTKEQYDNLLNDNETNEE